MAFDFNKILLKAYRFPAITAYNRLEARPRDINFDRSLKAEIRDAMWMLGRQWQTGEFLFDDAGSAAKIKLLTEKYSIDKIALKNGQPESYDRSIPLETRVERELVPINLQLRMEMGNYFMRLLKKSYSVHKSKFLARYQLSMTIPVEETEKISEETDSNAVYEVVKNRSLDGYEISNDITSGAYGTWINSLAVTAVDKAGLLNLGNEFSEWYRQLYSQPENDSDTAWDSSRLEYNFEITAKHDDQGRIVLKADQYYTGELDWYSFNFNTKRSTESTGYTPDEELISFLPAPVAFKGMPNARYWEMEERQTNFGNIEAGPTGLLHMLLAEFGLIYSNDWMVIPYLMPVNTICRVRGIVVTDVFGERTLIRAAASGIEGDWQRWAMYNMSGKFENWPVNNYLFLPSTLTKYLESDPLEKVNFMRDEMANMVWAVEQTVPGQKGRGINGNEKALALDAGEEEEFTSTAPVRYLLGTKVPSNWIPFIPVNMPGSTSEILFQRAQMPAFGDGDTTSTTETIKPRGKILTEVTGKYFILEEEIPKAGVIVKRTWQRTRWLDGKIYLWLGRRKETGRGQGNSGLIFDQIVNVKTS